MPIVFKAIMPHGDELLPFSPEDAALLPLRRSMAAIGAALRRAAPDVLVIASPHHLRVPGHLAIADTAYAEGQVTSGRDSYRRQVSIDRRFNDVLAAAAARAGLPPARAGFQTAEGPLSTLPLDFGTLVPLHYLIGQGSSPPVCIVGPPRDLGIVPLVRFGAEIAQGAGERRVAFVASADLAHAHRPDGPYGYDPAAATYDAEAQAAAFHGDLGPLCALPDSLIAAAKPDAPWQVAILHGMMPEPVPARDAAYGRPSYFGMMTARFDAP